MNASLSTTQTAPTQHALVEAQWATTQDLVDLPRRVARAVWSRRNTELVRDASEIQALERWPELAPVTAAIYDMPENRARVARVLNFIEDGDRMVDIGCGNGSLGGHILRRKQLAQYLGIDASPKAIESFRSMASTNKIAPGKYELLESMIEEAAEEAIPAVDPTIVLLLEMLEHVNDPGLVLRQTAAGISEETDLLISVPMLGEIEHEWGHVSVFDRARLERMTRDAGLYIHWVEPVMHQWLLLLLSKSPSPRPRLERVVRRPSQPVAELAADDHDYYFRNVDVTQTSVMAPTSRPAVRDDLTLRNVDGNTVLTIPATEGSRPAGVTIYRPGMEVLRIKLSASDPNAIAEATAEFRADGETLERWTLGPEDVARLSEPRTWVFRRGFDHGRRHSNLVAAAPTERLDLIFTMKPQASTSVTIHNAHCVSTIDNPTQPRSPGFVGLTVG